MSGTTASKSEQQEKQGQGEPSSRELSPQPVMSGVNAEILALQQSIGNQAVNALMQGSIPSMVQSVLNSGGQPMEPALRAQMESRFGEDFSQVRLHTDGPAAVSAQAVHAKAYTVGSNVVFSENRYAPETTDGKHLLAHELAHVVQQTRVGAAPAFSPNSSLDQAADHAGLQVAHGHGPVEVSGASAVGIARVPEDPKDRKVTTDVNVGTPAPTKQTDPAAQATTSPQARLEELQRLLAENQPKLEAAEKELGRQGGEVGRLDGARRNARLPADRERLTKEKEEADAKKFVLQYQVRQLTFEKLRLQEQIADIKRPAPANRQAAGREFEKENVEQTGMPRNFRKFKTSYPGPDAPDGNRIPDYVAKYGDKGGFVALREDESLSNADFISDSKLLGGNITLTDQIRGFIELAAQTKQKGFLILTDHEAQVSEGVRDFARKYNVRVEPMRRDPRQKAASAGATAATPTKTPSTTAQTASTDPTATAPKTATAQTPATATQTPPPTGAAATTKTAPAQTPAATSTDTIATAPKGAAPSSQTTTDPKAAAATQGKVRIDVKGTTDADAAKPAGTTAGGAKADQPRVRVADQPPPTRVADQSADPGSDVPATKQRIVGDRTVDLDKALAQEEADLKASKPEAKKAATQPARTSPSRAESPASTGTSGGSGSTAKQPSSTTTQTTPDKPTATTTTQPATQTTTAAKPTTPAASTTTAGSTPAKAPGTPGTSPTAGSSPSPPSTGTSASTATTPAPQGTATAGTTPSSATKPSTSTAATTTGPRVSTQTDSTQSAGTKAGSSGGTKAGPQSTAPKGSFGAFRSAAGRVGSGLSGMVRQQVLGAALDIMTGGLQIADAEEKKAASAITQKIWGAEVQGAIKDLVQKERLNIARKQADGKPVFVTVSIKLLFTDRIFDGFSKLAPKVTLTDTDESKDSKVPSSHDVISGSTEYIRYVYVSLELRDVELSNVERLRIRVARLKDLIKNEESLSSGPSKVHREELAKAQWDLRSAELAEMKEKGEKRRAEEQRKKEEEERRKALAGMAPAQTPPPAATPKPADQLPKPSGPRKDDQIATKDNPELAKLLGPPQPMTEPERVNYLAKVVEERKAKLLADAEAIKKSTANDKSQVTKAHQAAVESWIGAFRYGLKVWKEHSEKPGGVGWESLKGWDGIKRLLFLDQWVDQEGRNALMR